jgi:hypothetical protein
MSFWIRIALAIIGTLPLLVLGKRFLAIRVPYLNLLYLILAVGFAVVLVIDFFPLTIGYAIINWILAILGMSLLGGM